MRERVLGAMLALLAPNSRAFAGDAFDDTVPEFGVFPITAAEQEHRTAIDYEVFKMNTHLSEQLSLDEQLIVGSLAYNSGLTFAPRSRASIKSFATGEQLSPTSTPNARTCGLLPVLTSSIVLTRVRAGGGYPAQPTSWSAMYHVLQRYGGYRALCRFTTVFDEAGMYTQGATP